MRESVHSGIVVSVLGEPSLQKDGRLVSVNGDLAERLLIALVMHRPGGLSAEDLSDLIWERGRPANWASSLRNLVTRLRRSLTDVNADLQVENRKGLYFLTGNQLRLDCEVFQDSFHRAQSSDNPQTRMVLLEEALVLWKPSDPIVPVFAHDWFDSLIALRARCQSERFSLLIELVVRRGFGEGVECCSSSLC